MGKLSSLIGPRLSVSKKAYNNIKNVMPEKNEKETLKIIKGMWENLGRVIGEYPHLKKIVLGKNNRIQVCGKRNLLLVKKTKTPAIFFSAHLANWEICPIIAFKNNIPVLTIFRKPNNPIVNFLIQYLRSDLSMAPKGMEGAKKIGEKAKNCTDLDKVGKETGSALSGKNQTRNSARYYTDALGSRRRVRPCPGAARFPLLPSAMVGGGHWQSTL